MTKLPLWAWDEEQKKYVVFPTHLLTTQNGQLGLLFLPHKDTYQERQIFMQFRKYFNANPQEWPRATYAYFYALKEQVPDLDQVQREVGTDPILGDDHV